MNKVIIKGRIAADPEIRQTQSGKSACKFTVAVDGTSKDKDGNKTADFISCVAWNKTADFVAQYFKKGQETLVEGSIKTGKYQDKNHEDVTHYTTDIWASNVEFCGSKASNGGEQATNPTAPVKADYGNPADYAEIPTDGDTPF